MRLIRLLFFTLSLVLVLNAREQVNVNFSNLAISDFIKLISKITNKNILINHKINGEVNFVSTTPIYDDELIGILVSVLESKGFTLVNNGSMLEIVRSTEAAKHNAKITKIGKKNYGSLMVTQAIKVENENVDIVATKIRYLISKTAKLMTMKESNTLLITDYPKNIETVKRVIKDLGSDSAMQVKIFTIKNSNAKKIKSRLTEISKSLFNASVKSEIVKIVLDEHINGIVVVANKKNIEKLSAIVKKLDIKSDTTKRVKIFELKNSDAKAVLATLNKIISKQVYSDPTMKPNVSASEEINAIVTIGEPGIIAGIKIIIDELDKEKYQVYVKARIIEINNGDAEALGVKYGFDGASLTSSGLYSFSANFGGGPVQGIVADGFANSLVGGTVSSGDSLFALGAAIDFLESKNVSRSISNPSILCVNNKESSIYVGKTISITSGSVNSGIGAGGTTSSYTREDVGLTLKIKPRVSSSEKVTLDVETILENVTDDGLMGGIPVRQPETSKQEIKTQAILRHGENIIIGGLIKSEDKVVKTKVPLLGDIPLGIGEYLFSSTSIKSYRGNLIVILTPYIIDKSEKLSKLQKDLGLLEKAQEAYNNAVFARIEEDGTIKAKKDDEKIKEQAIDPYGDTEEDDGSGVY